MLGINTKTTILFLMSLFVLTMQQSKAQQKEQDSDAKIKLSGPISQIAIDSIDKKISQIDSLELQLLSEFQIRVRKRYKEVTEQGHGLALLLQPFSSKYRRYTYSVIDDEAVQGDIVLGDLRRVIKRSISNRDAGFKAGDPASKPVPGSIFAPPLIFDAVYRWPDGKVPYEIKDKDFTSDQIDIIENGIRTLSESTNLTLSAKTSIDKDYVLIVGNKKMEAGGQSGVGR